MGGLETGQGMDMAPGVLYVDSAIGSREFVGPLRNRHAIKTSLVTLASAGRPGPDFAWVGNGETGPVRVAVERKTISDLVGSLLTNRFFGKQVPALLEGYDLSWLVVEGIWGVGDDGDITTRVGKEWRTARFGLTFMELAGWLARLDVMGRGRLLRWRTSTMVETAAFVAALFRWWQKPWSKHRLQAIRKMPMPSKALMWKPNGMHATAASLPEIGIEGAKKVGKYYGAILEHPGECPREGCCLMNAAATGGLRAAGIGKKDSETVARAVTRRYR